LLTSTAYILVHKSDIYWSTARGMGEALAFFFLFFFFFPIFGFHRIQKLKSVGWPGSGRGGVFCFFFHIPRLIFLLHVGIRSLFFFLSFINNYRVPAYVFVALFSFSL